MAGYVNSQDSSIKVFGCQPEASAVMYESLKAERILEIESKPTLSDGTAGGIEKGAVTLGLCRMYVDDFILVTEDEIREAMKLFIEKHALLVEGAGALSAAAFIKAKERLAGKTVVLIISGGRIGLETLREILCRSDENY